MGIFDRLRRGQQDSSAPTLDDLPKTEAIPRPGAARPAPLSEKNPTRVNGEVTQGTELKDGDDVRLGDTTFRFRTVG